MNRFSFHIRWSALLASALCLCATVSLAQEWIWLQARINNKPARLVFDTAANQSAIYKSSLERLGIKVIEANGDSGAADPIAGRLEPCEFSLWGNTFQTRFYLLNLPDYLAPKGDGILGWGKVRDNLFWIDMEFQFMTPLREIPETCSQWTIFRLPPDADILTFEFPNGKQTNSIVLDTGSGKGVALAPKRWEQWRNEHPDSPTTLNAIVAPGEGLIIEEHAWAKTLKIGPLVLKDVPICKASSREVSLARGFEALLGAEALKQMIVAVDGEKDVAYVSVKKRLPQPYEHNRSGAVFVPSNPPSNELLAHVAPGSPAQLSGVRDEDVLLKINGLDVAPWHSSPEVRASIRHFLRGPAGSKLRLELRRGAESTNIVVTLREILGPKRERPSKPKPASNNLLD